MSPPATALTRRRYDRIAPIYDALEWPMEFITRRWRGDLWSRVGSGRILEIGVGTGKNIPYYPSDREVVAVDLSEGMLARARRRAARLGARVRLEIADVEYLPFAAASFDLAVASFLFCSVPDPARAFVEVRRILKPGGQLLLLEHVLSARPLARRLMRWIDPVPFHVWGAHIDRETVASVSAAGFVDVEVVNLAWGIVERISARTVGVRESP